MSEFFTDLNGIWNTGLENRQVSPIVSHTTDPKAGQSLEMTDFLQLMVTTFQNQSIDDTASISDMMNQMVQMSVIDAITKINTLVTESTNLSYAASLVGKEVTIGQYVGDKMTEFQATVTGTGTVNGKQAIFVGDDSYWLTDVLAVGRLPANKEAPAADPWNPAQTAFLQGSAQQNTSASRQLNSEEAVAQAIEEANGING